MNRMCKALVLFLAIGQGVLAATLFELVHDPAAHDRETVVLERVHVMDRQPRAGTTSYVVTGGKGATYHVDEVLDGKGSLGCVSSAAFAEALDAKGDVPLNAGNVRVDVTVTVEKRAYGNRAAWVLVLKRLDYYGTGAAVQFTVE